MPKEGNSQDIVGLSDQKCCMRCQQCKTLSLSRARIYFHVCIGKQGILHRPSSTANEVCVHSPLLGVIIKKTSKPPTCQKEQHLAKSKNPHLLVLSAYFVNAIPMNKRPTAPMPSFETHLKL